MVCLMERDVLRGLSRLAKKNQLYHIADHQFEWKSSRRPCSIASAFALKCENNRGSRLRSAIMSGS